jgi:hypothetical protein
MAFTKRKVLLTILAVAGGAILIGLAFNFSRIKRLNHVLNLFEADRIVSNFQNMGTMFDSRAMKPGERIMVFKKDLKPLPVSYTYKGQKKNIASWLKEVGTTGLIVVKDDTILIEEYYQGNTENSKHISWSVAKSFVSALFGIAVNEGHIKSLNDPVDKYVPMLKNSGYQGVRIKDVLQMSSGISFTEDYGDFNSDINRMGRAFALNTPLDNFVASLKNEKKPGTWHHYVSMDTQVLGMIIREATGRTISEYMEEKLWKPAGMESEAYWLIDSAGMETVFGGLNAVLRDYARFGRLFLNKGKQNGIQVVPEKWAAESTTPDGDHLKPGKNPASTTTLGYGYQWWIPENPDGDYLAIGIYGQAIYVYPKYNIVIARNGAMVDYNSKGDDMEFESIEVYRSIARQMIK